MKRLISIVLLLATGLVAGIMLDRALIAQGFVAKETALTHAEKHIDPNYICPMHSEIQSQEKGSCPICGMDLVEIRQTQSSEAEIDQQYPVVRVPSTVINNMGVRVTQVKRKTLVRQIETPGFIRNIRKESYSSYTAPAKGKVAKFHFNQGQWHEAGEPLVDIELDDLVLLQEKHLELLAKQIEVRDTGKAAGEDKLARVNNKNTNSDANDPDANGTNTSETAALQPELEKTRLLMKAAGMTDAQIAELEKTNTTSPLITLYAEHEGEVKQLRVAVGDEVKPKQLLFTLGGMMRATVLANAFQRDASWVKPGQDVEIILPHESDKPREGKVSSGAVTINTNSQNIGIKLEFIAPDSEIKNGMFVIGNIYGQVRNDTLTLPREAVIYSRHEKRVIVALGKGRFKPVPVVTGISNDSEIEILDGLEEGDTVVVSAQFLIDSESSLQASYRRMTGIK